MPTFDELWAAAERASGDDDAPRLIALLQQALELEPEHPGAWRELGFARQRSQDLPGAREAYEMALELDADNEHRQSMQFALGAVLLELDEPGEALYIYQEILDEDDENAAAYLQGGICFARMRQWEDAHDCIVTALTHNAKAGADPELSREAQVWRALCLAHLDRGDELLDALTLLAREFADASIGEHLLQELDSETSAALMTRVRERLPALRALAAKA